MSIRIHHIENAPPALLDYVFYGCLIGIVVAFVIVFHFSRKPRSDSKNIIQRGRRRRQNTK
jgi:hypothetical protein